MKKFTTLILMFLLSVCFVLTGCGKSPLSMPTNAQNVLSNGGFVVGAGNYMYFSNAYKSTSDLTTKNDNSGNGVAQFSLKRAQLNTEVPHRTWFDIKKEEGAINFENVLNKIAGYKTSNMYVVGSYLYFTSPNVHKNKQNEYNFNLTTLFRIKLDGSGLKEIYTTNNENAKFYLQGTENKSIIIFDGAIKTVNVSAGSTNVKTLVEEAENVVFPRKQEQDIAWLYYTTKRAEEDIFTSGNILNKVSVQTGDIEKEIYAVPRETIALIAYEGGRLFYTKTGVPTTEGLYSNNFAGGEIKHRSLTTGIENETDLMFVESGDNSAIVFLYNDNLYIQLFTANNQSQATKITTETTTLQFFDNTYVYYSTENGIYRYSILTNEQVQITDHKNINADIMDFDGMYVYFFAKEEGQETTTQYLYRADAFAGEMKAECIAQVLEKDIVEKTEGEGQE